MTPLLHHDAIDDVIVKHLAKFRKPGVLSVRPGIEVTHHQITGRPSIVAIVKRKKDRVAAKNRLPDQVEGIPVDVREATPMHRLRLTDPAKAAVLKAFGRASDDDHEYPNERDVKTGKLLTSPRRKPGPRVVGSPVLEAQANKPELTYTPASVPLKAVTRPMTILACASPDAGYTVLAEFLEATKKSLTVGMYDFTSAQILSVFTAALKKGKTRLTMVLDHPPLNPTANQTDEDAMAAIHKADKGASIAWALTRPDPRATKWIFPTSYHIKVAVRDSSSFWLSSGNWNVSNQPNLAANKSIDGSLSNADRDWHVVVMDEGLAKVFEAYIAHDHTVASGANGPLDKAHEAMVVKANAQLLKEQAAARARTPVVTSKVPFTLGKPKLFTKVPVTIQPLLTPDKGKSTTMYVEHILALLKSAKKTLYLQLQYINPSTYPADADFMKLVTALREALERGVDVRIITSQFESTHLEAMHLAGLSGVLRIQHAVHNKGIVVDSRTVVVSSQNWSADGTLRNRDAGVIIQHPAIAQFFEAIFLQDWESRSTPASTHPVLPKAAGHRLTPVRR